MKLLMSWWGNPGSEFKSNSTYISLGNYLESLAIELKVWLNRMHKSVPDKRVIKKLFYLTDTLTNRLSPTAPKKGYSHFLYKKISTF